MTVQATAGMMDLTGQADGPPTRSGVAIGDFLAGYNGAFGVMLALWERHASGLGQMVDVGLFDSTVLPVVAQAMVSEFRHTGRARRRIGNGSWYSFVDSFEALDGTVMICPAIESQWRRLARTVDRADLLDDPRYRDNPSRFEHRAELGAIVQAWVGQRTVDEVVAAMDGARVPCSRVLTVPEMARAPTGPRPRHAHPGRPRRRRHDDGGGGFRSSCRGRRRRSKAPHRWWGSTTAGRTGICLGWMRGALAEAGLI